MSILQEILTWSEDLADWQSDAIARLFTKQNLNTEDINDLYALLKKEHGIIDSEERVANRLTADQISKPAPSGTRVELLCVKNLNRVNALANDQKLSFGAKGLTVIYGDNGSGKSGYSRVLKKVCRARDQSEPILPNANLPPQEGKAEATFEINVGGVVKEEKWVEGKPADDILSTIAIFDHRCARAYVDEEDDFSYVPYGLDIFEGLASVCRQLKEKIDADIIQCDVSNSQFEDLRGSTSVGRLIENLSSCTAFDDVEALANIEPEDTQQFETLNRSLNTENPLQNAELLKRTSQRFMRVAKNFEEMFAYVNDSEFARFSELDQNFLSAKVASDLAKDRFNESGHLLSGTCGDAWKELFEAARKFSIDAYPNNTFPHVDDGAQCLLCQQPLNEGATRLLQFEEFIQLEAEQTSRARFKELDVVKNVFLKQNVSLGLDAEILAEIGLYDETLAKEIQVFEKELDDRFLQISSAFTSHVWTIGKAISEIPAIKLEELAAKLDRDADIFAESAKAETRLALVEKFEELDAKLRFSPRKDDVLAVIEKKRRKEILEKCLGAVKTNSISLKAKEVAEKIITRDLADALNTEFNNLGVGNLNVELKSRSDHGKPLFKLKLNLPQSENPINILSEGEQRAVAIGSFLAEVNLSGGLCGIIFDDPVSSLDHRRREHVARRFAYEASKRQVIVFTHDLYFLCILMEEAGNAGVAVESRSLIKKSCGFGVPENGNPFEGMSTKDRISFLRLQHQGIAKIFKNGDDLEYRKRTIDAYRLLRDTWERFVEEVLFGSVVIRFRKGVETQKLKKVTIEESDYIIVDQGMTKCSNYSHDKALIGGIAVPEPDELSKDIEMLESFRSEIVERSKIVEKSRK